MGTGHTWPDVWASLKIYNTAPKVVTMNTAIILAGGVGSRIGVEVPKQFLEVDGEPILAYTIQAFQDHDDIDRIVVVCISGWEDKVRDIKERYGLSKICCIKPGGKNSMESISNGIFGIESVSSPDDIVIIHDSVRPLINGEIISDCIAVCKEHGNGCAAIPIQETIVRTDDHISGIADIDRSGVMRVQTPQAYRYGQVNKLYRDAYAMGINDSIYTNTLMMQLGHPIYFSKGSPINIKITVIDDINLFNILLNYFISNRDRS